MNLDMKDEVWQSCKLSHSTGDYGIYMIGYILFISIYHNKYRSFLFLLTFCFNIGCLLFGMEAVCNAITAKRVGLQCNLPWKLIYGYIEQTQRIHV